MQVGPLKPVVHALHAVKLLHEVQFAGHEAMTVLVPAVVVLPMTHAVWTNWAAPGTLHVEMPVLAPTRTAVPEAHTVLV